MPVLARTLEAEGLSTVFITMMPFWAECVGVPRTLAVEFPFAQTLGRAHDSTQQMRVIRQALEVLETVQEPGTIIHSEEPWPQLQSDAIKDWQPAQPSPIIEVMAPQIRALLRQRRNAIQTKESPPTS